MLCVNELKECDGCMACKENEPILIDAFGDEIYEGDAYYEIGDLILSEESIKQYRSLA